jgi:hypothetical protein
VTILRFIGRAVIRTLEFIWYPACWTLGLVGLNAAGVFDGPDGSRRFSYLIVGVLLWKLARMITRTDPTTAVKLFLSFGWLVGYFAWWSAYQPQWGSINAHVGIALFPLFGNIRRVFSQDAEVWIRSTKWYRRRQRASAGRCEGP